MLALQENLDPRSDDFQAALFAALLGLLLLARAGVRRALRAPLPARLELPDSGAAEEATLVVEEALASGRKKGLGPVLLLALAVAALERVLLPEYSRLVQAVAQSAGSTGYLWTTRKDTAVRELHRHLEGTVQSWADPPVSGSNGFRGPPGTPAECRCVAFPIA